MKSKGEAVAVRAQRVVVLSFAGLILFGAVLLSLPVCSAAGRWTPPLDSLFTATSAVCVTGLAVVDTGSHFSLWGQFVIMLLIQAGGLGIMTVGTTVLLVTGRRPSIMSESALSDTYGGRYGRGLLSILRYSFLFTLTIEFAGMVLLYGRLESHYGLSVAGAMKSAWFHSVSAFCNAGFALHADSLAGFRDDPWIIVPIALLVVLGGMGFPVALDLMGLRPRRGRQRRPGGRLSIQSRIMLVGTLALVVLGTAGFLALEWRGAFAGLSPGARVLGAVFEAITPRTAGFTTVDYATVRPATLWMVSGLMFVGGGPGGTAGGVKVTTLAVLLLTGLSLMRNRFGVTVFGRAVPEAAVRRSIAVFMSMLLIVFVIGFLLMVIEGTRPGSADQGATARLLFETISALGTAGLSTGITASLSNASRICLIVAMFVGRLGPLTIALIVSVPRMQDKVRYPEEAVMIG